jgi:phosphatidylinositol glycan class W
LKSLQIVHKMDAPLPTPVFPISEDDYKQAKINFVSGLTGTSIAEIAAVTLLTPCSYLTHSVLLQVMSAHPVSHWSRSRLFEIISHLILVEGSMLLGVTIASHRLLDLYTLHFGLIALLLAYSWLFLSIGKVLSPLQASSSLTLASLSSSRKSFISVYRAQMMLTTVIAILAVDFYVFPRRFAKTEEFGFGLMDVGVGSFIISHALVSPMARSSSRDAKKHDDPVKTAIQSGWKTLIHVIKSVSPMLLMGSARFFLIRSTNYQEHVTEYGVHWNFFFTLAIVALLSCLINPRPPRAGLFAAVLIVVYQFALHHGLENYILFAPRVGFVSANKEGICSSIGYFALYLFGVELGHFLNRNAPEGSTATQQAVFWWRKLRVLIAVSMLLLLGTIGAHQYISPCSRRMVRSNLIFISWSPFC